MINAKELDNETSYTYFGARYYDSELSVWLSVDPMSDKYPSLSPYCYSANNLVVLLYPNETSINPIYDTDENSLETDNQGLKGNAIVMKKSDFKQGMSHEEALSKSTELNTNNREGAEMKMKIHYYGLNLYLT
jgi:RHS repeat-associated protein